MCTLSPLLLICGSLCCRLTAPLLVGDGDGQVYLGELGVKGSGLGEPWRAYLKMLSPVPPPTGASAH